MRKKRFSSNQAGLIDPDEILADSISVLKGGEDIWEGKIEKPIGRMSSLLFMAFIILGMGYLAMRAEKLQIIQGQGFFEKSQENRFLTRSIFPARGIFYDRNHKPLVENIPSFSLVFEKDIFMNAVVYASASPGPCVTERENIFDTNTVTSARVTPSASEADCTSSKNQDPARHLREFVSLLSSILKKDNTFFFDAGFPSDFNVRNLSSRLVVARDIPLEMVAEVSARRDSLPGIEIVESYRREYAHPLALSHAVGFTGKISENDLSQNPQYQFEESIGKNGLEQFYDADIRGKPGKKIVEVDSRGRETRFRLTEEPTSGSPLLLTLDGGLQQVAYDLIKNYTDGKKGGSVVVTDVNTGAIRALVSFPGFDANRLSAGVSGKEFQQIVGNRLSPLFNRSIAGEFPSGSVIKPLFAAAALQEHIIDPHKKIYDEGYIEIPNPYHPGESSIFKDWRKQGWIDFYDAIAYSANVYFYMIGGGYRDQKGLGIERLKKYGVAFGLGSRLGIDIAGEKNGFFPDPSTKSSTNPEDPIWRIGDTYNVSIGQGGLKITPLQITSAIAAVANGGKLYEPHLLDAALDSEGNPVNRVEPRVIRENIISPEYLAEVRKAMRQTVTSGTARLLNDLPVNVAAKTGTAQAGGTLTHAWFVAFAPYENPEIAITVMVEHGGEGSAIAAPITKEILKWYFSRHSAEESATSTPETLTTP